MPNQNTAFIELIKVYLPLVIVITTAAVTWGMFTNRLANAETRINNVEVKQAKIDDTLTDLRVDVASIAKSVSFIEKQYK